MKIDWNDWEEEEFDEDIITQELSKIENIFRRTEIDYESMTWDGEILNVVYLAENQRGLVRFTREDLIKYIPHL